MTEAAEIAAGRAALVVAAALVGIRIYNANGDRHRHRCPCGVVTADVMLTMAGERGGEVTARRRRGDGEATATATRQRRGNKDAKAIGYGATGGRGNEAINKRITNNINNK